MVSRYHIKSIFCAGMHGDIRFWNTQTPLPCYLLELTIGEARTRRRDTIFKVLVSTPEALREMAAVDEVVIRNRATIVVAEYDFAAIEAHLSEVVARCNRPEWMETAYQLRRYFREEWESSEAGSRP